MESTHRREETPRTKWRPRRRWPLGQSNRSAPYGEKERRRRRQQKKKKSVDDTVARPSHPSTGGRRRVETRPPPPLCRPFPIFLGSLPKRPLAKATDYPRGSRPFRSISRTLSFLFFWFQIRVALTLPSSRSNHPRG